MIYFFNIIIPFIFCTEELNRSIEVKILIKENAGMVNLRTSGKVYVEETKTGQRYMLVDNSDYDVKIKDKDSFLINDETLSSPIFLSNLEPQSYIEINGTKYKGRFKFYINDSGKINIVEYIDIERYILGVLGPEIGVDCPFEALKSQAVAARTYAVYMINRNGEYDMSATTKHQVYTGFENISPQIISAVNATKGEVLTYRKKIFPTYYHANSGGHTTSPTGAWDIEKIPPLKGVKDPYAKYSKNYEWKIFLSERSILRFLATNNHIATKIKSIKIYSKEKTGRAIRLRITTDKGSILVYAKDLRDFVGSFQMKSTLITNIQRVKDGFLVYGRGWGHGVGLCQDGAKRMAELGYNYKKILEFYYPGSKIMNIEKVDYEHSRNNERI